METTLTNGGSMRNKRNDGWCGYLHKSFQWILRDDEMESDLISFTSSLRNDCHSSAINNFNETGIKRFPFANRLHAVWAALSKRHHGRHHDALEKLKTTHPSISAWPTSPQNRNRQVSVHKFPEVRLRDKPNIEYYSTSTVYNISQLQCIYYSDVLAS